MLKCHMSRIIAQSYKGLYFLDLFTFYFLDLFTFYFLDLFSHSNPMWWNETIFKNIFEKSNENCER